MQHPAAVFFFLFLQCMLQRKEKAGVLFSLHRKKKGALLKSRGKCLICRATPARTLAGSFSLRAKWAGPVLFSLGQLPWKQVLKIMHEDHYKYSFIFTVFFFFLLCFIIFFIFHPPSWIPYFIISLWREGERQQEAPLLQNQLWEDGQYPPLR